MSLENFRPRLIAGRTARGDGQQVFIPEKSGAPILLPDTVRVPLELFDGEMSVKDIAKKLYEDSGKVRFRDLFLTLKTLCENGLLEDAEVLARHLQGKKSIVHKPLPFFFRPLWKRPVVQYFGELYNAPELFWGFAFVLLSLGGFLTIQAWPREFPNNWLRIQDSYLLGVGVIWLSHSLALTIQAGFQCLFTYFSTGVFSGLEIAVSPFAVYLKTSDVAHGIRRGLSHRIVYFFISLFSPLIALSCLIAVLNSPALAEQIAMLFPIYLIVSLDPYRQSQLSHFFSELVGEERISEFLPYLKKRSLMAATSRSEKLSGETAYVVYSAVAILWSFYTYGFFVDLVQKNLPNLIVSIQTEPLGEKIAAGVVAVVLVGFTLYMIYEVISIFVMNIFQSMLNPLLRMGRGVLRRKSTEFEADQVVQALENTRLFSGLGGVFLHKVVQTSSLEKFRKGSYLLIQGDRSTEIFLVLRGTVRIEKRLSTGSTRRLAEVAAGAVIGESALMSENFRTADARAADEVVALRIPRGFFDDVNEVEEEKRQDLLLRIAITQFASKSALFDAVPAEVVPLIVSQAEVESYRKNDLIIREKEPDRDFYLLLRGNVEVVVGGKVISEIGEGGFFGEVALIADSPRTASIRAKEEVQVLRLAPEHFWDVLSNHVNLGLYLETVAKVRGDQAQTAQQQLQAQEA